MRNQNSLLSHATHFKPPVSDFLQILLQGSSESKDSLKGRNHRVIHEYRLVKLAYVSEGVSFKVCDIWITHMSDTKRLYNYIIMNNKIQKRINFLPAEIIR